MEKYTIYCTEEQTKKALKLGAPIDSSSVYYEGFEMIGHNEDYSYKLYAIIPTAAQMIGWLEERGFVITLTPTIKDDESGYTWIAHACYFQDVSIWIDRKNLSRKEAMLAAIDAILNYLIEGELP